MPRTFKGKITSVADHMEAARFYWRSGHDGLAQFHVRRAREVNRADRLARRK